MMRAVLVLLALVAGSNALLGVSQSTNLRGAATSNFFGPFVNGLYKAAVEPNHDYLFLSNTELVVQGGHTAIVRNDEGRTISDFIPVATVVAVGPAVSGYKVGDKVVIPQQCANNINSLTGLSNLNPMLPQAPRCQATCFTLENPAQVRNCQHCRITECISVVINNKELGGLVPQGLILGKYTLGSQATNDGISGPTRFSNVGAMFSVA